MGEAKAGEVNSKISDEGNGATCSSSDLSATVSTCREAEAPQGKGEDYELQGLEIVPLGCDKTDIAQVCNKLDQAKNVAISQRMQKAPPCCPNFAQASQRSCPLVNDLYPTWCLGERLSFQRYGDALTSAHIWYKSSLCRGYKKASYNIVLLSN